MTMIQRLVGVLVIMIGLVALFWLHIRFWGYVRSLPSGVEAGGEDVRVAALGVGLLFLTIFVLVILGRIHSHVISGKTSVKKEVVPDWIKSDIRRWLLSLACVFIIIGAVWLIGKSAAALLLFVLGTIGGGAIVSLFMKLHIGVSVFDIFRGTQRVTALLEAQLKARAERESETEQEITFENLGAQGRSETPKR